MGLKRSELLNEIKPFVLNWLQQSGDAGNLFTEAEHLAIGDNSPHHEPITIGAGSDPALMLDGQELTLDPAIRNHSALDELDYASSGHTGFAGTGVENTFTEEQTFDENLLMAAGKYVGLAADEARVEFNDGEVEIGATAAFHDLPAGDGVSNYYNLCSNFAGAGSTWGALKLTMPLSWSYTMIRLRLEGNIYSTGRPWSCVVVGYNYGTSTQWLSEGGYSEGTPPFSHVQFGHDGTHCCFVFGDVGTFWSQGSFVTLAQVQATFYPGRLTLADGWTLEYITDLSGITFTGDINLPFKAERLSVGRPATAPAANGDITAKHDITAENDITANGLITNKTAGGFQRALRLGPQNTVFGNGSYIEFTSSGTAGYGAQIGGVRSGAGAGDIVILTGGNAQQERMRITDSGDVGIGTTSPDALLDVAGDAAIDGTLSVGNTATLHDVMPALTDTYDLGSSTALWRKGWLSELDTVLFAENTMQVQGGWLVIGHGQGTLAADVASADTTVDFGQPMTVGDIVVLRQSLQVEYLLVGEVVPEQTTIYNVSRNVEEDVDGPDDWPQGAVYLVLGSDGDGRIELNAHDTPRISLLTQGATYGAADEMVRIGDLNGLADYNSETWGAVFGQTSEGAVSVDDTNGVRIWGNGDVLGQWDVSGGLTLGDASGSHIQIDSTYGIQMKDGASSLARWHADGSIDIGADADRHIHLDTSGNITMMDGPVEVSSWNASGAVVLGNSSLEHVEIDSTNGVRIMDGVTVLGQWDTSGAIAFGQASKPHVEIDATNGVCIIDGSTVLGQWDTSGGLTLGEVGTDKANVYYNPANDRLEFRGNTTVQSYIDTDGAFVAGGGNVSIAADGINLEVETLSYDRNSVTYWSSFHKEAGTNFPVRQDSGSATGHAERFKLSASDGSSGVGYLRLEALPFEYDFYGTWKRASGNLLFSAPSTTAGESGAFLQLKAFGASTPSIALQPGSEDETVEITNGNLLLDSGYWVGLGSDSARVEFNSGEISIEDASLSLLRGDVSKYYNVANYYEASSVTGTIKLTLPASWSKTMWRLRITGYDHTDNRTTWECVVSGYNSSSTNTWQKGTAEVRGRAPFSSVRLAHDGTRCCVLLGTLATSWAYPAITVAEIQTSYYSHAGMGDGWALGRITSETGITTSLTPSVTFQTNRMAVGNLATGLPNGDGDMNCARYSRIEGGRIYLGTGNTYIGINGGKASYYDGSSWHDFY